MESSFPASIMDYGAAGNGSTNDTTAVNNAFAAAAASGDWLTGLNKTYAVSGDINVPAGLKLEDCTFKQLSPNSSDRKTLSASQADNIHFRNVTVNRNGSGNHGSLEHAGGMWFDECKDIILERCEVYGNDKGTGIVLLKCDRFTIDRPYIHDIRYTHTTETDDCVQGIWLNQTSNGSVRQPVMTEFGRKAAGELHNRFSRCLAMGGCDNVTIDSAVISRCDQAIDVTGSGGNSNIAINGGTISHVYSSGVKFANSAGGCSATGVVVEHAGLTAFFASGPHEVQQHMTRDILFKSCIARNTGSQGEFAEDRPWGFSAQRETADLPAGGYPKNIRFVGCLAVSDQGSSTFTVYDSDEFTLSSYLPLSLGTRIRLITTGALPGGLASATDYWLIPVPDTNRFKLASSYSNALDGAALSTSSAGSGTHTVTLQSNMYIGFYADVPPADSAAPNFAINCRATGYIGREFAGVHSPIAIVKRNTAQSVSRLTWTDVLPNSDILNSLALIDTSSSSPDFVVPFEGVWRLEANLKFSASNVGSRELRFLVDTGSGYAPTGTGTTVTGQTAAVSSSLNAAWEGTLKRGDKIKVQVYHGSGSSLNLSVSQLVFRMATATPPGTVAAGSQPPPGGSPPSLSSAVSRKTHGASGALDIPLPGIECRSGGSQGAYLLVFTFNENLEEGSASIASGAASLASQPAFSGNTMSVELAAVQDAQTVILNLSGVRGAGGGIYSGQFVFPVLVGDVDGSGGVSSADQFRVQQALSALSFPSTIREDVNASGGVSSADMMLVRQRLGNTLP